LYFSKTIGPNKSFTILVKNVISLPYSLQRKNAYVLTNFTILSASKNPWAYPLSYGFPFTDIYIKPCSSILFPFCISIEEREENDGVEVDAADISADATGDCITGEGEIVDIGDIGNIGAVGDIFGARVDVSVDDISGDAGDIDCGSGSGVDDGNIGLLISICTCLIYIYKLLFLINIV
jgi:hypothetical protein